MGGQDKGLVPFAGRPLVEWVLASLAPQVRRLLINANRNQETDASLGHPVIEDRIAGFQGPLAGFASAMAAVSTPWMATVPYDGPFLAPDLVGRLCAAREREDAEVAVASDGVRMQPVYALLPVAVAPNLEAFLAEGERKTDLWYARQRVALADLSDRPEGFADINSEADSVRLKRGAAP
jgi:molybdopterin-guanine dinucleotide biosynthesis protein A